MLPLLEIMRMLEMVLRTNDMTGTRDVMRRHCLEYMAWKRHMFLEVLCRRLVTLTNILARSSYLSIL